MAVLIAGQAAELHWGSTAVEAHLSGSERSQRSLRPTADAPPRGPQQAPQQGPPQALQAQVLVLAQLLLTQQAAQALQGGQAQLPRGQPPQGLQCWAPWTPSA